MARVARNGADWRPTMSRIEDIKAECEKAKTERWAVKRNCPGFALQALHDYIPYLLSEVERLTALSQNGQSAIDTNLRLVKEIKRLTVKLQVYKQQEKQTEPYELSCDGCEHKPDMPSHVRCQGCARMYVDKYIHKPSQQP